MTAPDSITIDRSNAMRAGRDAVDWADPFPPRDHCRVTPLIEAADMYPTLERAVLEARRSVWLGFRIFDPDTKTRSDAAKDAGLTDWTALIRDAVERGVEVRILLADFEPIMANELHAGSWSSFYRLRELIDGLDEAVRKRLQIIVVEHEGELGWWWRQILRLPLRFRIRRLVVGLIGRDTPDGGLLSRPGLWRYLGWDGDRPARWKAGAPPRLWPATYHQKFAILDGERAIIGGLDLDERRWDDRRHRRRADQTWHDMSALVEGAAVADAARHFAILWNRELPRFRTVVGEWTNGAARRLTLEPLTDADPEPPLPDPVAGGAARVQIVRTISRHSPSLFAFGPVSDIREIKAAHRALIGSARKLLYLEAQFFRSQEAASWVIRALRNAPELEVIILIANVPEEIAFEGEGDNPAHRHGEYLQSRALGRLLKEGQGRVGLFTLAKQERVRSDEQEFAEQRGTAFGSGLVHIHAKLVIADDAACLLSSANINGRSFEWDTELGLIWRETGDAIAGFRARLWQQLWGDAFDPDARLAEWRRAAEANSKAAPEDRRGFVVPYQLRRARRYARPFWFVPDDLV